MAAMKGYCVSGGLEDDQQILPLQKQHRQRDGADDDQLQHVAWRDGQDVAREESSSPKRCELCALFSCFFRINKIK